MTEKCLVFRCYHRLFHIATHFLIRHIISFEFSVLHQTANLCNRYGRIKEFSPYDEKYIRENEYKDEFFDFLPHILLEIIGCKNRNINYLRGFRYVKL